MQNCISGVPSEPKKSEEDESISDEESAKFIFRPSPLRDAAPEMREALKKAIRLLENLYPENLVDVSPENFGEYEAVHAALDNMKAVVAKAKGGPS